MALAVKAGKRLSLAGICVSLLVGIFVSQSSVDARTLLDINGEAIPALSDLMEAVGYGGESQMDTINAYLKEFLPKSERGGLEMGPFPFESRWESLLPIFQRIGMVDRLLPAEAHYHYVLFVGQTVPLMRTEMQFVKNLVTEGKLSCDEIVFLTGRRSLDAKAEGDDPVFAEAIDEMQAAEIFLNEYFPEYEGRWTLVVAPGAASQSQPDPKDAIGAWLNENAPVPNTALMVSNNPFIACQYEALCGELAKYNWFTKGSLDACGDSAAGTYVEKDRVNIMLGNVARTLQMELENSR